MAVYGWARHLSLRVGCIPRETLLGKTTFSFTVVINRRLWVRDGDVCPLLSVLGPHLAQTCAGLVRAATVFGNSYGGQSCCLEAHFSWCILSALAPLPEGSPELQRQECDGEIPFRTECPRPLTICPLSGWGSLYLFSRMAGGSASDDSQARKSYEYRSVLPGVILFRCFFRRAVIFVSLLVSGSWPPEVGMGYISWSEP